ncbi:30S ribosomal protein S12 methylthiotransferase RimO [Candidatus Aerophobetes bacterium]|nr:30S ribosomal protein S12 methylthiotransferase RimO [Candidatus Aerophobetes bacterium]
MKLKVNLISLGCPKNLVDSEVILGRLGEAGYAFTSLYKDADIIIINTCSFINKARSESYKIISRIACQKSPSQKLIVCGCLPQLKKRKLFLRYPQIDALIGSADFYKIDKIIEQLLEGEKRLFSVNEPRFLYDSSFPRLLSTPPSYAYLKIAEGCSNHCSYCLIPYLRGRYRSRPVEDVVKEAKALVNLDIKELILVAQDITFYGWDKGEKSALIQLLNELEKIDKLNWIRLLYAHPLHFTSSLIKTIATSDKICRYIDIPLQHTHNEILVKMKRPKFEVAERLIAKLREEIPGVTLRTTFIVGFPGEKDKHVNKLLKDIERIKFEWLGAFTYSPEKGTLAYSLAPKIPLKIKKRRYAQLMQLQQPITLNFNQEKVDKVYSILVDKENEGHTEFQAPEIDGKTFLKEKHLPGESFSGKILQVKNYYDLVVEKSG